MAATFGRTHQPSRGRNYDSMPWKKETTSWYPCFPFSRCDTDCFGQCPLEKRTPFSQCHDDKSRGQPVCRHGRTGTLGSLLFCFSLFTIFPSHSLNNIRNAKISIIQEIE